LLYFFAPIIGWVAAGSLKYFINYLKSGKEAKQLVGNGGFPSNHTTTITSVVSLIGCREGFDSPIFGLGIAVLMIIIFDATGLRRYVGHHATVLNTLTSVEKSKLRERIGHSKVEVLGGLGLGSIIGVVLYFIS